MPGGEVAALSAQLGVTTDVLGPPASTRSSPASARPPRWSAEAASFVDTTGLLRSSGRGLRIQCVSQAVADEVDGEHREQDGHSGGVDEV